MIVGGIVQGSSRPYNLYVGTSLILDIFYKNNSMFQSIFTHWAQTLYCTWDSQSVYTWQQEIYAQESATG